MRYSYSIDLLTRVKTNNATITNFKKAFRHAGRLFETARTADCLVLNDSPGGGTSRPTTIFYWQTTDRKNSQYFNRIVHRRL